MTNEERDIITRFVERAAGGSGGGSVPGAGASLPAIDPAADALIAELFTRYPEARYRLTQMAFVQEHALAEAQNRISQLQYQLAAARQAPPPMPPASRGGFFSGLFGSGGPPPWNAAPAAPPPQPAYAPGYQPGMFQRGGPGFLGSALSSAAGVAGGVVMGNALMNLLSPHAAMAGNFAGPEPQTIVNETINEAPSPWANPGGAAADPWGAANPPGADIGPQDAGFDPSQSGFDPTQADSNGDFDPGSFGSGDDSTDV
ncbi:MAG: DUF2076 domain-containing protein [Acetobacteraceae bacterium]